MASIGVAAADPVDVPVAVLVVRQIIPGDAVPNVTDDPAAVASHIASTAVAAA